MGYKKKCWGGTDIPVGVNPVDTINVRLYRIVQLHRWKRKRREGIKKKVKRKETAFVEK
jgi:hypothetical protein